MVFDKERKEIRSIQRSQSRERNKLDRVIFILTTGTLSLSATFVSNSTKVFVGKCVLFVSWLLLITGLLFILLAYIFAELYFKYRIKKVEEGSWRSKEVQNDWRNRWVSLFNLASLVATSVGIIIFAYFAFINLP